MNNVPLRAGIQMNGWEVLEQAIPRGEAEAIGDLLGAATDTVRRWRRQPEADDEASSGRRSPLDQVLLLLNAVYTRNPDGAALIVERINSELARLQRIHGHGEGLSIEEAEDELRTAARNITRIADVFAGAKAR